MLGELGPGRAGALDPRATAAWQGKRRGVRGLAIGPRPKWREQPGAQAAAAAVYAPGCGKPRLAAAGNRRGDCEHTATSDLGADPAKLVLRRRSRRSIGTASRGAKQPGGSESRRARADPEAAGGVKARWRPEVPRDGDPAPEPLRARPLEPRTATA